MFKRILAVCSLLIFSFLGFSNVTYADFQAGITSQLLQNQIPLDTAQLNWWFTRNIALRGDYSWSQRSSGLGIIYKIKPGPVSSPYFGFEELDVTGKVSPELSFEQKLALIAGMEWGLPKVAPGLSLAVEASINPFNSNISNQSTSKLEFSINYRIATANSPVQQTPARIAEKDLYLLAKLITLEAPDEPFEGQVAVGAVVLNRINSPKFPDSIQDVIYQPKQFSPARKLATTIPKGSALRAAEAAFDGNDPSNGALYFYNPSTSSARGKRFMKKANFRVTARIGNHLFLK